jgi:A/G-specific adenine glycosylase
VRDFSSCIIEWQLEHGRHDLPWQGADAYRVWLSEIMLQQTQVATVIPYYRRFVTSFPEVAALAAASEDSVLAHWSGLGYYSRARNLHRAAQLIMQRHDGEFPRAFDAIMDLPGIGRSTAAAISALAFHEPRAILDGNVKRVLARYCAIEGFPGDNKIEALLWRKAEALLPQSYTPRSRHETGGLTTRRGRSSAMARESAAPADAISAYTQGLMDLGATICTRTRPDCGGCPVRKDCAAYRSGRVLQLPTPRPRKSLPEKRSTFLMLLHGSDILLEKRPASGIWGSLWCPPQFDDERSALAWCMQRGFAPEKESRLSRVGGISGALDGIPAHRHPARCESLPVLTHTFTHFRLQWLGLEEALRAAIPAPVRRLIEGIMRG